MEFRILPILAFLMLALVTSHAGLSPEHYWNSVLPNTPMPKAVRDLLQPDLLEDKSTSVNVGKGGVNVNAGKGKPGGTYVNVGKGGVHVGAGKEKPGGTSVDVGKGGVNVHTGNEKPGGGTHVNVGGKDAGGNTGKPGTGTNVGVGKGGVSVSTGRKGKPVYVGVKPGPSPFDYRYAAKNSNAATFLPRQVAKSIPFSSNKLPEIFNHFSVNPGSLEAEMMQNTIKECEEPGIKGEQKNCATSLESMIDFSTSKLGKSVRAISTEVAKGTKMQKYTIAAGVRQMAGDKSVVCHKQNYPYAVFYCHATQTTRAYTVPLEGADETKVKAVAVCHTDTSAWNPKHLAFQVLKVKPGTIPVCHFLPEDHIIWVPNKKPTE
ncbi:BURP domain protein RD22 [Melia azedarach]|uniref:BURP domain protein RD22 n=1 Tax=Melia azedarach TaxID=155640 RepID=A0ACC1XA41_MELAZ|nr:BURP domain protein RD22 [Melia azedarach]